MSARGAFPLASTRAAAAPEGLPFGYFSSAASSVFCGCFVVGFSSCACMDNFLGSELFQSSVFRTRSLCAFYYVFVFRL